MARRRVLYKDLAGNRVILDTDGKLGVFNKNDKLVNPKSARVVLRRKKVKEILMKKWITPYFKRKKRK